MLVAALEIDVGRPGQLGPDREHRFVTRSGIEPYVEDVHLALEARAAAVRAREPRWNEIAGWSLVPGFDAVPFEHRRRTFDERRRHLCPAALRAVDRRDRHTPCPLARDAPVGPVRDHVVHAIVTPGGNPVD